jgi:hypothetical protein
MFILVVPREHTRALDPAAPHLPTHVQVTAVAEGREDESSDESTCREFHSHPLRTRGKFH